MVFTYWFMFGLLILITTFGVGCTLNMLFKQWWLSLALGGVAAAVLLYRTARTMILPEWIVFGVGCMGAVLAAWAVLALRKRGYPLFS